MTTSTPSIVLITGANQGLGYATASLLSQSPHPYTILLGSRDLSRGQEAATNLSSGKSNAKTTITALQLDLTSSESISTAVEKITNEHGRLDTLINNAGIFGAPGALWTSTTRPHWRSIFEVNVFGAIELTELALPLLRKSSSPRVVVVSSNMGSITKVSQGHVPTGPPGAYYSASKAAINAMAANWSQLHKDVSFWVVCPGLVGTEFGGEFTKANGRVPGEAAEIVRKCVEGEKDGVKGKFIWEQGGEEGVYEW